MIYNADFSDFQRLFWEFFFFFGTERGSGQKQNAGQRERKARNILERRGRRSKKATKDKQKL